MAVVGAGLAGLAAAHRLHRAGLDVAVFEKEAHPGGRSASFPAEGVIHDVGAYTISDLCHETLALIDEIGLSGRLNKVPPRVGFVRHDRLVSTSLDAPAEVAFSGALSARLKLAALSLYRSARAQAGGGDEADGDMLSWARRHVRPELIEELLDPLAALFFLQDLGSLSRKGFLSTIDYLTRLRMYCLSGGMGQLANALAEPLNISYQCPVERAQPNGDGSLSLLVRDRSESPFDAVVLAVAGSRVSGLLGRACPASLGSVLHGIRYAPAVAVHLLLSERLPDPPFLILLSRRSISGIVVDRIKDPFRMSPDQELLTVFLSPQSARHHLYQPDEVVVEAVCREVAGVIPTAAGRVIEARVQRWSEAAAEVDPGYQARAAAIKAIVESELHCQGIFLAGDYLLGSSVEGAVASGLAAAASVLGRLQR